MPKSISTDDSPTFAQASPGSAASSPSRNSTSSAEAIVAAVHEVRDALSKALSSVTDPQQPRNMSRQLEINRGLAWRVSRAVTETRASEALRSLPRPKSLRILLDACGRCGAPATVLERARAAILALEETLSRCGEERRSVPVLIVASGLDGAAGSHFASARQQLFDGARIIWGVEAETILRLVLVWPGSPGELNSAVVRATVDLTALRHGPWPVTYQRSVSERNEETSLTDRSIDDEAGTGLPFIARFCSPRSLPVRIDESRGMRRYEVTPATIGRSGRLTCVLGSSSNDTFEEASDAADPPASMMTIIETPTRRLQLDLMVHDDLELTRPSRVLFCDRLTRPHGFELDRLDAERLPLDGVPEAMGRGAAAMATARLPWHVDLIEHVTSRLGLDPERFVGYRHETTYPPISTAALLQFWAARRQKRNSKARKGPSSRASKVNWPNASSEL